MLDHLGSHLVLEDDLVVLVLLVALCQGSEQGFQVLEDLGVVLSRLACGHGVEILLGLGNEPTSRVQSVLEQAGTFPRSESRPFLGWITGSLCTFPNINEGCYESRGSMLSAWNGFLLDLHECFLLIKGLSLDLLLWGLGFRLRSRFDCRWKFQVDPFAFLSFSRRKFHCEKGYSLGATPFLCCDRNE